MQEQVVGDEVKSILKIKMDSISLTLTAGNRNKKIQETLPD
jgi:hypothetical protein